ncbi:hypothetical protein ACOI1H_19525 [Loktanella sp. DJP18]|uniref:hypothetical protein n=1 Tax=Loktanella sp. DJP18 TaxID=3409788 RepID=UPI003BB4C6E6
MASAAARTRDGALATHEDVSAKTRNKRLDGSVQKSVYQSNKRGKPLIRAKNRTQINRKMLRHWRGAAKILDRCAKWRQISKDGVLFGECRFKDIRNGFREILQRTWNWWGAPSWEFFQ